MSFIRGLFDTDFGFCLSKRYRNYPYYPQIAFSSKSQSFTREIWEALKISGLNFKSKIYKITDKDKRAKAGFTVKYSFYLYGNKYLVDAFRLIKPRHPKHINKFREWFKINKENPRVKKLLDSIARAGFEFADSYEEPPATSRL